MVFDPPLLHPNSTYTSYQTESKLGSLPVYPDGTVCISILHAPGDDPLRYESANERWSPVQGVRSVLLSVLSMLAEPNIESGADVDVSQRARVVWWRCWEDVSRRPTRSRLVSQE